MELFDTHAHLNDEAFDADRDELIRSLPERGISRVMDIACDVRRVEATIALIDSYPFVYGAVGMHPHDASEMTEPLFNAIRGYMQHEKMLAVGEIGLDYHYDFSPRDVQRKWFDAQLSLAKELDAPVVLHIREAFGDGMDMLRAHRNGLRGVMHCFSGSYETARDCIDMGLYIAFGGALTFQNAKNLRETAARLPLDRLLLETDCPYLTPTPHRSKRNDPTYMVHTANVLAGLFGLPAEDIAQITYRNALDVFGLTD